MADGSQSASRIWSLAEAKAKFSEVIEKAASEGPQRITRNGRPAAVVVSVEEWARVRPQPSLTQLLTDPTVRGLMTDAEMQAMCRREGGDRPVPDL